MVAEKNFTLPDCSFGSQIRQQPLVATTADCSGDFATDSTLPRMRIFPSDVAGPEIESKVKAAVISLPMYRKYIKPYRIEEEKIRLFKMPHDGKVSTYVTVYLSAGDACGNGGIMGALWEVEQSPTGPNLAWIRYLPEDPVYATDVDNDGYPDFYCRSQHTSYSGFINGKIKDDPNKRSRFTDEGNLYFEEIALHDDPC